MRRNDTIQIHKKMKHITIIALFLWGTFVSAAAQGQKRLSPEKFQEQLELFIIKEACLTQQESKSFLPLYREMRSKQKELFDRGKKLCRTKPAGESGCASAIKQQDKIDVELKKTQQTYHNKFLNVLPASKVFEIIKAEEKFHRRMLRKKWSEKPQPGADQPQSRHPQGKPQPKKK